jgi:hypothetical protein
MEPTLTKPIMEFMRGCDHLLRSPIRHYTLTGEEMEIIKLYMRELTERFVSKPVDRPSLNPANRSHPHNPASPMNRGVSDVPVQPVR